MASSGQGRLGHARLSGWSQASNQPASGLLTARVTRSWSPTRMTKIFPSQAPDVWREQALPDEVERLLALDGHAWRTMESMACARVRPLAAQGDVAAAERVAASLCATASERGLTRTHLRGLALSMAVAERAGHADHAVARLVEFLRLARQPDYVRPLVRTREVSRAVLGRLLDGGPDAEVRDARSDARPVGSQEAGRPRVLAVGAAGAGRGPAGPAEPGDRRPPRDLATGRAVPPDEHLPQDRRQQPPDLTTQGRTRVRNSVCSGSRCRTPGLSSPCRSAWRRRPPRAVS